MSTMSGPNVQHNKEHRKIAVNPIITIIPQSPPMDSNQNQNFIYETPDVSPQKDPFDNSTPPTRESIFHVTYYGELVLDRRYTRPMLPWIMAEIRRKANKLEIKLEILSKSHFLQATSCDTNKVLFQHKLPSVSSFARAHLDPTSFVYLTRASMDQPFSCHVFQVTEESKVSQLFTAIREATKEAIREAHHHNQSPNLEAAGEPTMVPNSHLCEVMYVGKVVVTNKKAPPTFIDEAVEKFREHDSHQRLDDERRRHSSGGSVQSLPADLEQVVPVRENELSTQTTPSTGSINEPAEDDPTDTIPLGGSSSSFLLTQAVRNIKRQRKLSLGSDVVSCQDSMKNILNQQVGQGEGHAPGHDDNLQKYVLQSQSHVRKNRTMLLQVGQSDISLISTKKKKVPTAPLR